MCTGWMCASIPIMQWEITERNCHTLLDWYWLFWLFVSLLSLPLLNNTVKKLMLRDEIKGWLFYFKKYRSRLCLKGWICAAWDSRQWDVLTLCKILEMKSYMHQNAAKLLNRSDTSLLCTQARKQKAEGTGTTSIGTSNMDYISSKGCIGRKCLPSRQLKDKNWRTGTRQLTG